MKIVHTIAHVKAAVHKVKQRKATIGFVPTMGALHEGHRSLLKRARHENDVVVVSLFVNPLQFGPKEDYQRYPKTLKQDLAMLKQERVDLLFNPSAAHMFPETPMTSVEVPAFSTTLCAPFRPGHFKGVATVVAKLFEIVEPMRAYFGQKDYQQCRVIERMVKDLSMPVRVVVCPTVREPDGLAYSSRNQYLSAKEREEAVRLYQALYLGRELIEQRIMLDSPKLEKRLKDILSQVPNSRVDYVSVVDPVTLAPMKRIHRPALLAGALWINKTRLIDNVIIS